MTELSQSATTASIKDNSLQGKAADSANAAQHAAGDVAQTAADKAKDVAGEAQRQARDLIGEARDQLSGQVGSQHRNLVENLQTLADELSRMANASEQQGLASELVGQAGDRARGAADWIGNREPGDLVDEVRSFARRRPGTFLIGALVAGVAVGRLTRGAVAAHSDGPSGPANGTANGATNGAANGSTPGSPDTTQTQVMPSANAMGYSSPPEHQGLPTAHGGSAYGGVDESQITSGMPSSNVTPPGTFPRPPEPPAPAGPGPVPSS